jgi:hypothetical protein
MILLLLLSSRCYAPLDEVSRGYLFCGAAGLVGGPQYSEQPVLRTISPDTAQNFLTINTLRREFAYADPMPPIMPRFTENWLAVLTAQRKHDALCPV